ncbi:kinase-like protein, partial [Myriangium duriaei CBS 260.36]
MSLIPYPSNNGEVVLRHGTAVVTVDPQSQQMTLRENSADHLDYGACPYCHRPYHDNQDPFPDRHERTSPPPDASFVNPDYFRMLAEKGSVGRDSNEPPASPTRRLRALRSGQSRNVSSSSPPSGAEFIGSSPAPAENVQSSHSIKNSSFLPGYFKRFFVERRTLGRGGRGVVLLVEHVLDGVSLGEFACKRIPVGNDHDWLAKVLVEVQLLQRLNHPNLVAYRHVWLEDAQTTKFGPSVPCVFILQQYCNAGDLHQYVQSATAMPPPGRGKTRKPSLADAMRAGQLSLDEILAFFKDITSGLHHLHANGYIHRDLKPSNCLLHSDGRKISVHVSDFGEVQVATTERASTGATGTISYCAPEVLQRETPDGAYGNFTTKSDIFSLGMILFYMCFASLPYTHADINEENEDLDLLRAEITAWTGFTNAARIRPDLPDKLYDVLRRLLSISPHDRPSTAEILASAQADEPSNPRTTRFSTPDAPPPADALQRRPSWQPPLRPRHARWSSSSSDVRLGAEDNALHKTRSDPQPVTRPSGTESPPLHQGDTTDDEKFPSRGSSVSPGGGRLLLPPPPAAPVVVPSRASTLLVVKTLLFLAKLLSLTWPCLPYATRPGVLYPLLGLAVWELL